MIKLNEIIIVEGKYDKIKLETIFDTLIIVTNGFDIFSDKKRLEMIKTVAEKRGAVILTDSDWAGFEIRHKIASVLSHARLYNAYIPDIYGKEKRKEQPSKEGKLGVEGVDCDIIIKAVKDSGVTFIDKESHDKKSESSRKVTKTDLFCDGLSGSPNSSERLDRFKELCRLPEHISKNALLDVINSVMSYDEYKDVVDKL